MNTPAHVIVSGLAVGARPGLRPYWLAITLGALLPDAPMVGFYLWERFVLGVPEMTIWREHYHEPGWQALFDAFNSLPLAAAAALLAWWMARPAWLALALSVGVHCLADLPLHHHDAHRHFWPLLDWRFRSPISYWDPRFHGQWFGIAEAALTVAGAVLLWQRRALAWKLVGALTLAVYAAFLGWASLTWA